MTSYTPPPRITGSSPLARGLLPGDKIIETQRRIIPARAGFTMEDPGLQQVLRGSSPLARGLLRVLQHFGLRWRIIPARAGFTTEP